MMTSLANNDHQLPSGPHKFKESILQNFIIHFAFEEFDSDHREDVSSPGLNFRPNL